MTNRSAALLATLLLFPAIVLAETPATMRLDYFHTGNRDMEMFSVDQVVIEPLPSDVHFILARNFIVP